MAIDSSMAGNRHRFYTNPLKPIIKTSDKPIRSWTGYEYSLTIFSKVSTKEAMIQPEDHSTFLQMYFFSSGNFSKKAGKIIVQSLSNPFLSGRWSIKRKTQINVSEEVVPGNKIRIRGIAYQ